MREIPKLTKSRENTGSTLSLYKGIGVGQALRTDHVSMQGQDKGMAVKGK